MITLNEKLHGNAAEKPSFKSLTPLGAAAKAADIFIKSQENLSSTRFIQDTATNWLPKAVFSRSKADFAEMSFLEFIESAIFYFAPPILGEKLFRNALFKHLLPKNIKNKVNELIPKSIKTLETDKTLPAGIKKRAVSLKAGIILACAAIPIAEYTLSFAKNLFTLKTFKKSNFNNIANLDKSGREKEDKIVQARVEKNAKKQLKKAAALSASGVIAGALLAVFGHKSDVLQKVSKTVINPFEPLARLLKKLGIPDNKAVNTLSAFSLDFADNSGKLALSKGQLALTAILGLFGYSKAAEDRGKLDKAEVWTRVPLVVFYTIFGSELFEKGFSMLLKKKNLFPDIVKTAQNGNIKLPLRNELPKLAQELALKRGTDAASEYSRLLKQKAAVQGVPYAFSLLFMGFTLSCITRLWTQYRYNCEIKQKLSVKNIPFKNKSKSTVFKEFLND